MLRTPASEKVSYRRSISRHNARSTPGASLASLITGHIRCGMRSNSVSSTRLGSIITKRTSFGVLRISSDVIRLAKPMDLPLFVAPPMSRWGIRVRSA